MSAALVPAPDDSATALMIERLASDPNVDVTKLEKIIGLHERVLARRAKVAFAAAFVELQLAIPEMPEHGVITNRDGRPQSRYAKNEDIQAILKPILHAHGFELSFRTEWLDHATVKVIGILTHRDGHERTSEFVSAPDTSGNKSAIQALGSAVSYGHRYTAKDLLNLTSRGEDDGGQAAGPRRPSPEPPAPARAPLPPLAPPGYEMWLDGIRHAWTASRLDYRQHLMSTAPEQWAALKAVAERAA